MPAQHVRALGPVLASLDAVMLTTVDEADRMVSRPMVVCVDNVDGALWFFAPLTSRVVEHISANSKVNISYCGPPVSLSITGTATVIPHPDPISARWQHALAPWLADDMANVAAIEVVAERARLWTSPPPSDRADNRAKPAPAATPHSDVAAASRSRWGR
ncbi:MAG: pyridoxamine 5'-phosphate oxidase family protein [Mycolicibacterium sp.]